jgi:hypothetical protein
LSILIIYSINSIIKYFVLFQPLPPYLEDNISTGQPDPSTTLRTSITTNSFKSFSQTNALFGQPLAQTQKSKDLYDTCFHLIKLYCNNKYPIADIIAPQSHTLNQLDFRLR